MQDERKQLDQPDDRIEDLAVRDEDAREIAGGRIRRKARAAKKGGAARGDAKSLRGRDT